MCAIRALPEKDTTVISNLSSRPIPHPQADSWRLARLELRVLQDLIDQVRSGIVPVDRLFLAGVPPLVALERELRRRTYQVEVRS